MGASACPLVAPSPVRHLSGKLWCGVVDAPSISNWGLMMFRSTLTSVFLACIVSTPAMAAPSFVVKPVGQALSNTCQSYALGVALAFKQDPAFRIDTSAQLRAAELAIRSQIKAAAGAEPVNHDHVKKGFEAFTGGA